MKTNTLRKKRKKTLLWNERRYPSNATSFQHQPCTQRVALLFSSLSGQRFSFMGELEACWFNERGPRVAVTLLPSNVIILRTVARNRRS